MEEVFQKDLLREFVADLEQKVADNTIKPDDFKTAIYQLKEAKFKIQGLLDFIQDHDGEMKTLYRSVSNENLAELVDDLNALGYRYQKSNKKPEKKLKEAFKKMGYRIMEQTRAGKRDDVFYSFMRIYMSVNASFDKKLLFAFKHPNNEMFKVLVFSFLSGIIETKTNIQE
jgi:hypothetical protein